MGEIIDCNEKAEEYLSGKITMKEWGTWVLNNEDKWDAAPFEIAVKVNNKKNQDRIKERL